jgi:toxin FitB
LKLVDSSGWIEYFGDGPLAAAYRPHLAEVRAQVTSPIVVFEVYRRIKRERGEHEALEAVAQVQQAQMVPITPALALTAADLAIEHHLALADSVVYATAVSSGATLITSDSDFAELPGVVFLRKP